MTYISVEFLVYLTALTLLYRVCPVRWRNWLLLAASYAFYCTWSVTAAAALAAVTVLTFLAGKSAGGVESPQRSRIVSLFTVSMLTGYLVFFKIVAIVPGAGPTRWMMPLGLSYYTFKLISYVLDIYWGKMTPETRFINFAAYVAFFPQIVAGPIARPNDFLVQLPPLRTSVYQGIPRIAWGLTKKLLIAENLAPAVNYIFNRVTALHGAELLAGLYLFPLQLYADFSGLTDIAIGIGLLFGIESPENFNRPFTASSISDYWRRWHMSLTTWLVDYLFTPLRIATRAAGNAGLAFSIAVNMIAIGLWHGLTWGYFAFGLLHAFYLVIDALTIRRRSRFFKLHPRLDRPATYLGCLLTFHLVAIALVFFRAQTIGDAVWLLSHCWLGLASYKTDLTGFALRAGGASFALGLAGYAVLEMAERFRPDRWLQSLIPNMPWWVERLLASTAAALLLAGILILVIQAGSLASPFLYQAF